MLLFNVLKSFTVLVSINWLKKPQFWILVIIGILLASSMAFLPVQDWMTKLENWLKILGFWAFPAFTVIYILVTSVGIPNVILIAVAGTLFGFFSGIVSASIADTLGTAVCYGLGRTLARKRVKQMMEQHPRFTHLDCAIEKQGWKIVLCCRLSPIIPSNLLNYGFSCTRINFWQYMLFTWLGMLPVIGLYTYVGSFGMNLLHSPRNPSMLILQAVGLVATIVLAFYTTRFAKSVLSQS